MSPVPIRRRISVEAMANAPSLIELVDHWIGVRQAVGPQHNFVEGVQLFQEHIKTWALDVAPAMLSRVHGLDQQPVEPDNQRRLGGNVGRELGQELVARRLSVRLDHSIVYRTGHCVVRALHGCDHLAQHGHLFIGFGWRSRGRFCWGRRRGTAGNVTASHCRRGDAEGRNSDGSS
eukprot:scaffold1243_cov118-Isochrysis_galbana.AAC.1